MANRQIGWSQEANLLYQISALITRLTQVTAANGGGGAGGLEPYANLAAFPVLGTAGITYVAADTGFIYYWNGTTYVQIGGSPFELDGLTATAQFLSAGSAGTDFDIVSSGDTHTFNIPTASATNRGLLSPTDYVTFSSAIAPAGSATLTLFNYYNFV
jgi:hypothetical protein